MARIVGGLDNRVRDQGRREQVEALTACLAGTEGLLGGILDIARLDAGAVRPQLPPCDLGGLLRRIGVELAPFAVERGVRLRVAEPGSASCRERVCQYVEISGVDGSLKKEKKTNKHDTY